ncbi:unnamed protein product [Closterium sp. Naga37s-1]|nr:unnamed protein product [Closterium sp. Naga37s-1]
MKQTRLAMVSGCVGGCWNVGGCWSVGGGGMDACYQVDCGKSASCSVTADGTPKCSCNATGHTFNEADKTCNAPSVEPTTAPCPRDCGPAKCVVEEGKAQCKCPSGLVFNEAEKTCSDASYTPATDPCKAGTLKCDKNSKCVVKNGQGSCECDAGYTKRSGLCTAVCKRACPVNAQCTVERGKPVCRCKTRFKMEGNKCIPVCTTACPANAECKVVQGGKPACQCKAGFRMVNGNKCTRKGP